MPSPSPGIVTQVLCCSTPVKRSGEKSRARDEGFRRQIDSACNKLELCALYSLPEFECADLFVYLQIVRSNRRFMPSQADEEVHQLSYLQKHLPNILALLGEPAEEDGEEVLVLSLERFEHLGLLLQFEENGLELSLSQAAPFFANSDPDMPAVPVPAAQVHEWILQNISASLEHPAEKLPNKDNGPLNSTDSDITMTDASTNQPKGMQNSLLAGVSMNNISAYARGQTFIEGISKTSVVKQSSDIKGHSVKVLNCHDSVIYILSPLRYVIVNGCSDATVVLGAIGKAVRVEHCERVQVITAARRVCIANCRECVFFLGVNQRPLILGDNHKLQVAPYNTFYSQLEEHMTEAGIVSSINRWDEPLTLGVVDPHDSLSHPAGVSDVQAEAPVCLDPYQFTNFLIPRWFEGELPQSTKQNPFPLPDIYLASQKKKFHVLDDIKQSLRNAQLEDSRKRELANALHLLEIFGSSTVYKEIDVQEIAKAVSLRITSKILTFPWLTRNWLSFGF
ncbi:TBCC domain-containing protein 1 [Nymphaea thermarum]|nr:TBCC domain-containing protein 1 [Nymphaea thermarum]